MKGARPDPDPQGNPRGCSCCSREMVKKCEPHGIRRLSLEFCGEPSMTINRFEDAYAIVEEVNSPLVGVTLDQYHFYAMAPAGIPSKRRTARRFSYGT